ncbi:ABC transporter substrate-binding protein [Ancylobacter aquaticus]|nr:ABC transporter substrate-binding protein [Ancylobacter aquaticus]
MTNSKNTLNIGLDWEVDLIDPPCSFGGWNTGRVAQNIFESLIEDDLEGEIGTTTALIPALAERVTVSPDGLTYRFDLRQGVRFHDGAAFDAEAVRLNFARMRDTLSPVYSPIAANYNRIGIEWIDAIKLVDPFTVDIELGRPFPDFLRYMTQEDAPGAQVFVSPAALEAFGPDLSDRAPGTGPFIFEERFQTSRGSGVTLRRNDAYWGEAAKLEKLRFLPFPDATERLTALLDGTVDLAYGLDGADLEDLQQRGFVVHSGSVPYVWYLIFNMSDPVLADRRVRQAIAHAFDREALSDEVFRGQTRTAKGILPPASPAYDPEYVDPYPYDLDQARRLLAQAAPPPDWVLRVMFATAGSAQLQPTAIIGRLASDLAKVGINLELCPHEDWVEYCKHWQNGMPAGVGVSEMSWGMSCDVWLDQVLHSRNVSPHGVNAGYCRIYELDSLLEAARHEREDAERTRLYRCANDVVMRELPVLPVLTVNSGTVVHSPRVAGFRYARQNWHSFRNVSLSGAVRGPLG